jgi:hypothetical protein
MQAGYVYIVHGEGTPYIKIGKTTNILSRLQQLQNGVPFSLRLISVELVPDMETAEDLLLNKYQRYQTRGEWCELPPDLLMQWPLDTALPQLLKEKVVRKEQQGNLGRSVLADTILSLLEEHGPMTNAAFHEALEASSRRSHGRIRICLFRLVNAGMIERTARGIYQLASQPLGVQPL